MLLSSLITPQLKSRRTGLHHDPIVSGNWAAGGTCDAVSYQTLAGRDQPRSLKNKIITCCEKYERRHPQPLPHVMQCAKDDAERDTIVEIPR